MGGSGTTICYNLTTKPADTFLVGLWCKCGGVTTTCPKLGHIRATLLPHSDHTVWWKCGEAELIGALHCDKGIAQIKQKAQNRQHTQAQLSAHLVLAGGRSQQVTAQAKPKQRTQTTRDTSNSCALPIVPNLLSSHPTIKEMRAEQTGDKKRITLV